MSIFSSSFRQPIPRNIMLKVSILLIVSAAALAAQTAPAVRLINTPDASSKQTLGNVAAIRQLPTGRLLVNDVAKRQLLMFDPTLSTATIIADSTSGGANSYGPAAGSIIAYTADSTLFIDPRDLSMFVLDPNGAIARVAAVPRSQDAPMLGSNILGSPALDSKGRLVYRGGIGRLTRAAGPGAAGGPPIPDFPDSSAIVRIDLATRKLDTAAFYKIPKTKMNVVQSDKGFMMTSEINPMQTTDDWAVLSDGTIAIVRGQDYHIDWVNADGSTTTSAKLSFDWQRLSDEDKVAVIDSAKAAMERAAAKGPTTGNAAIGAGGGSPGMVVMNFSVSGGDGAGAGAGKAAAALGASAAGSMTFVSPSDLPDYRPVFSQGAARADLDGNLWVRTSATRNGAIAGPIYDVINRKGEIVDRLQVPSGRVIVGFAKGGIVYMMARDDKGAWIERTHR
jgi:hypothetical protein